MLWRTGGGKEGVLCQTGEGGALERLGREGGGALKNWWRGWGCPCAGVYAARGQEGRGARGQGGGGDARESALLAMRCRWYRSALRCSALTAIRRGGKD